MCMFGFVIGSGLCIIVLIVLILGRFRLVS